MQGSKVYLRKLFECSVVTAVAGLSIFLFMPAVSLSQTADSGTEAVFSVIKDDFNDNKINSSLWKTYTGGSGPTVAERNKRLEITFPANSSGDSFGAGYISVCTISGDFDIQVDYSLLTWPKENGVRVGMGLSSYVVERISLGNRSYDFPDQLSREVYATDFSGYVQFVPASGKSGKLRWVRSGSEITGYYRKSSGWVKISSSTVSTGDGIFGITVWSHDYAFTDQQVKIAFDNFIINKGELTCEGEEDIIVNTTGDESDADLEDGVCDVDKEDFGNQCTLRAAIEETNHRTGTDTITFAIPTSDKGFDSSTSMFTISPKKPLPTIKEAVVIDATTHSNGTVELDGKNAGDKTNGFRITAKDCTIKGLVIKRFKRNGILLEANDGNFSTIELVENSNNGMDASDKVNIDGGINASDNGGYGIKTYSSLVIDGTATVNNNDKGGILTTERGISTGNIEVMGNGGNGIDVGIKGGGIISQLGNVRVLNNNGDGILVNGTLDINGTAEVSDNTGDGIWVEGEGGEINVERTIKVENNGEYGIHCVSTVSIDGTATVNNNGKGGIWTYERGVSAGNIEVSGNGGNGIEAGIQGGGLGCTLGDVKVLNNNGDGILVNGTLDINGTAEVSDNTGDGIWVEGEGGEINVERTIKVENNSGYGIHCVSTVSIDGTATVNNNGKGGIWTYERGVSAGNIEVSGNGRNGIEAGVEGGGMGCTLGNVKVINNKRSGIVVSGDLSINGTAEVSYNTHNGIWAVGNNVFSVLNEGHVDIERTANAIGNGGVGIRATGDLTINGGKICDNKGGDVVVGGSKNLNDVTLCDTDSDNVSDEVEELAENNGDGNNDGISDSQQGNVASLKDISGNIITISSASGTQFSGVYATDTENEIISVTDQEVDFPGGILGFTVEEIPSDNTSMITLFLSSEISVNTYWVYGYTSDNTTSHWYEFMFDGTTGAEIQGNKVTLYFVDGQRGDNDLTANESIVHAGAPGAPKVQCEVELITVSPTSLTLNKNQSSEVTVTVTGKDDCLVEGATVKAVIQKLGKNIISVSPTEQTTDESGNATFTITAEDKAGNATVKFKCSGKTTTLNAKVGK